MLPSGRVCPKPCLALEHGRSLEKYFEGHAELVPWPLLNKVATIYLSPSGHYIDLLRALLPKCPSLRDFNIYFDESIGFNVEGFEVSKTIQALSRCTNLESIILDVGTPHVSQLRPADLKNMVTPLPNLKLLQISCWAFRPQCVVAHPSYLELHLISSPQDSYYVPAWEDEEDGESPEARNFGSRPSRTTSGGLSRTLVTQLDCAPCLQAIWLRKDRYSWRSRQQDVLHIQSFKKDGRELYHGRLEIVKDSKISLNCHAVAYTTSKRWHWKDTEPAKFDGKRYGWYSDADLDAMDDMDDLSLDDYDPDLDREDPDADGPKTGISDLTCYQGYNLPFVLLDYVYSQIDCPREWTEGQRGLPLPDHVWEVLDDWVEEIEKLKIQDDPPRRSRSLSDEEEDEDEEAEGYHSDEDGNWGASGIFLPSMSYMSRSGEFDDSDESDDYDYDGY